MQGGVGAYTQILAHELAAQGHDIRLFSTTQAQSADLPLQNNLIHWNFSSLSAIRQWTKAQSLDILNLQFQTAAYGMSPWIHFLPDFVHHCPVVTTFHDLRFPYLFPKAGPLRTWIVNRLAQQSAGVIVTNHEDKDQLPATKQHRLIPIGSNILAAPLPSEEKAHWRAKLGLKDDDFVIANFGLVNRSKGLDTLLDALAIFRQDQIPAHLIMIGGVAGTSDPENAAYLQEIDQRIQNSGLAPYIHRTGFVDESDVAAYLQISDVVALPFLDGASYRRGSLMAAIHYGTAILTTTPEVNLPEFIHGENMYFAPPGNPATFVAALHLLNQSPATRQKLQHGAQVLAENFKWSSIAAAYIDFFQTTLGATS